MSKKRIRQKRDRLLQRNRELLALAIFFGQSTRLIREQEQQFREDLKSFDVEKLDHAISLVNERITYFRGYFGVKVGNDTFVTIMEFAEKQAKKSFLAPKWRILQLCDHYEKCFPDFTGCPLHARIEINLGWERDRPTAEVYLLEGILFEHMCALFNDSKDAHLRLEGCATLDKVLLKRANALASATCIAAFNFMECYLNALACECLLDDKRTLTIEQRDLLTEHDSRKGKPRRIKFRDKLLQYPKIAAQLAHPPLQENNDPDVTLMLGLAKSLRDSIVHSSPQADNPLMFSSKEVRIINFSQTDVEAVVDATVALARKIGRIAGDKLMDVWLLARDGDGRFPSSVFS